MKKYYKDFCGATASIETHRDGSATLRWSAGGKRYKSEHANEKAALAAWRRKCN